MKTKSIINRNTHGPTWNVDIGNFGNFSFSRILALMIGFVITRIEKNYHLTHRQCWDA